MSILNKVTKAVKDNKILTFSFFAIVVSLVLLAIPGAFAQVGVIGNAPEYTVSGYEYIFNAKTNLVQDETQYLANSISGIGLAGLIIMVLTFVGLFFSNKSSFLTMLLSLALLTASVFFFAMEGNAEEIYPSYWVLNDTPIIKWASYVIASLLVLAGGLLMYKTVLMMKDEIKRPAKPKGPTYSYLK